jgi:hypothetical protein
MRRTIPFGTSLRLLTALLLVSCAGESPNGDPAAGTPDQGQSPDTLPANAPVTVGDIARWERGMAAELTAVREAGEKLQHARTADDTLSAMMGVQEMTTTPAGARAAGVDEERYRLVRSALGEAVGYLTPHLGGIDTTKLSAEQRDELRKSTEAQLTRLQGTVPADVVEALKPKADALRKKEIELAGARLEGAGL